MKITYEEALNRIAEVTVDNARELRKSRYQRRTEFTDLYGVPFTVMGDGDNPAKFYISISPDLVYFLRFQFKLQIQGLMSTVTGSYVREDEMEESGYISGVTYGIHTIPNTSDNFTIKIHGVDITDYLIEQQDGDWIEGEGIYPNNQNVDDTDYYDVLSVATIMYNEGRTDDAEKLLKPEFKLVEIDSDQPFQATMYLYMKYSVSGR